MTTYQTKMDQCPVCNTQVDALSNAEEQAGGEPQPGDLSICVYCTSCLVLDKDLKLQEANTDELDPETLTTLEDVRAVIKYHRRLH